MGLYLAHFVTDREDLVDPKKLGWLLVDFRRQVRWARPHMAFGTYKIPTPEWIRKFGHWFSVAVDFLDDDPAWLVWTGIIPRTGKVPPEIYQEAAETGLFEVVYPKPDDDNQKGLADKSAADDFPYVKILEMGEHLKILVNEKEGSQKYILMFSDGTYMVLDRTSGSEKFEILDSKDGTFLVLDRTSGSEKIQVKDGTLNNEILMNSDGIKLKDANDNELVMASDGVKVNDHYLLTHEFLAWFNENVMNLGMGNMGIPVPVFPSALTKFNLPIGFPGKSTFKTDK